MLIIGLILIGVAVAGAVFTYAASHYNSILDYEEATYMLCFLIMVLQIGLSLMSNNSRF